MNRNVVKEIFDFMLDYECNITTEDDLIIVETSTLRGLQAIKEDFKTGKVRIYSERIEFFTCEGDVLVIYKPEK